jgi:MFS family permease
MSERQSFRVRSLTTPIYVPTVLFAAGQGAIIPVIALLALDLGATPAIAGLIVACRGLGTLLFDLPAGAIVSRVGDKRSMLAASGLTAVLALLVGLGMPLGAYALVIALMGAAWSCWTIARLTFATEASPTSHRGRVMSMIGGINRIGWLVGYLLGGLAIAIFGIVGPFLVQVVLSLAAVAALAPVDPTRVASDHRERERRSLGEVFRLHRRTLATAGLVVVALQILRSSREALIPLWGDHIGVGAGVISLIFAASATIEIVMFYPVGGIMDRRGRKWTAIPCLALFSIGIALIPLASAAAGLVAVALLLGVANGLGAGLNMTLGSDLSPGAGRSEFLGMWRTAGDVGTAGGPLLVALVTAVATLGASAVVVGGIGLAGVAVLSFAVPETRR